MSQQLSEKVLREKQIEQFLGIIKNRWHYVLFFFLFRTGARITEVVGSFKRKCGKCALYDSKTLRDKETNKRTFIRFCTETDKPVKFDQAACAKWRPWFPGLRVEDINSTESTVTLHRKRHARDYRVHTLPIDPETLNQLKALLKTEKIRRGRLFPWTKEHAERLFKRYLNKAGLPNYLTLHTSRHSHVTLCYDKTNDPFATKERAGHSRLDTTLHYTHVTLAKGREVVNKLYGTTTGE